MAFGDTVQTATGSGSNGNASATLSAGATAGNLLVFSVARSTSHTEGGAWGTPTGFTDLHNTGVSNGNLGGGAWYKIATGSETTVTSNGTNEAGNWTACLVEYEGPFASTPLDVTAENEDNIATTVTSQASGTTATTAQADALAIAYFNIDNGGNFGTKTYSNSFTEVVAATSGARAGSTQAKRVLTATGTYSSTLSYSAGGTADEMYGAIAVWKKSTSGAYTLDVDAGSYTVTNTAISLEYGRKLDVDSRSYALSFTNIDLTTGRMVGVDSGSYSTTLTDIALQVGRLLDITPQSVSLGFTDITLEYGGGGGNHYTLNVDSQSYALGLQDIALLIGRQLGVDPRSLSISLTNTDLSKASVLDVSSGTVDLGMSSITLTYSGATVVTLRARTLLGVGL